MVVKSCDISVWDSRVFSCGRIYFGPDKSGWRCLMVHMEVIHFFQISHLFTPLYPKKPAVTAEVVTTWRWCHQLFFKNIPVEFFHFSTARHKTSTRVCWLLAMPGILKKNGENFSGGKPRSPPFFWGGGRASWTPKPVSKHPFWSPFGYNPHRIHGGDCIFTYMKTHKNQPFMVVVSFFFHHYLGKISNLTNIFQMAWNHQPFMDR